LLKVENQLHFDGLSMQQKYMLLPMVGFVLLTIEEFVNFLLLQQWDKLEDSMDIHEQQPTKIN
jgi:hypothetical protein